MEALEQDSTQQNSVFAFMSQLECIRTLHQEKIIGIFIFAPSLKLHLFDTSSFCLSLCHVNHFTNLSIVGFMLERIQKQLICCVFVLFCGFCGFFFNA